ncbi:hypothetical protein P3875_01205 [Myroides sp. JBRI-B21084]|uniref:hypothetical protein n=1 Tax=Myroides sp. JBRI-B21084 TaxID=3119977 RepID=UPI0026E15AE5|nr:hypothetical protein [Paenimyroides cloacae]WKW46718.1 hypothetical protein P3875_01205 [Paenimyroides cloacae]
MKKTAFFIIIIVLFFACDKKSNNERTEQDFLITDTVSLHTSYQSVIDYKDVNHDKFTEQLNVESKLRWIISYYVLDTIPYLEKDIYQNRKDSVLVYDAHKIKLKEINFSKTGTYYISGIVKDRIVLDSIWTDGKKDSEVSESVFWKKIIVINK